MLLCMHELVYVLTIEAAVFGMVGAILVAQRWNVLEWSSSESPPVFSSSLLFIFAYAELLLIVCCALAASNLGTSTLGVMDACARSAGRLCTAAVLSIVLVTLLLVSTHVSEPDVLACFLTQLLGTSCTAASSVLWSYSIYLSVLLPVWALVAGLLVTAAGMCKNPEIASRARLLSINSAFVLTYHVHNSLRSNTGCMRECGGTDVAQQDTFIISKDLLFLLGGLCVSDVVAEYSVTCKTVRPFAFLSVISTLLNMIGVPIMPFNSIATISGVQFFCIMHFSQVLCVVSFWWVLSQQLPLVVIIVYSALAALACIFDVIDVVVSDLHKQEMLKNKEKAHTSEPSEARQQEIVAAPRSQAFEVDTRSRRKFMMTFNGRSRWPTVLNVPSQKKTT